MGEKERGSKRRRPAYFRELKVLTCVGGQFTEESAAHLAPNPEPWNSQGVKQHVCCEEGGGNSNSPAHLMHSILLLSISQHAERAGHPHLVLPWSLCLPEGSVSRKGTLLLTDVVLKAAAASWSGGGGHLIFLAWKILWTEIWLSKGN